VADSPLASLNVRIRVMRADENAFGPGKADILESLLETGSLNRTASGMKMSYVKALSLVHAMNDLFREPLVELSRGGKQGGGAQVTDFGRKVLAEYRAMCEASEMAGRPAWRRLRKLLKD
jgi:molybdate transport system regulatory protein